MNRGVLTPSGRIKLLSLVCGALAAHASNGPGAEPLTLHTRSQSETAKGSGQWQTTDATVQWDPQKTAIVVCDMWNQHWCQGATRRVAEMAPRMNEVLQAARRRGVFIIHCPSDTLKYYEGTAQRRLAQAAPKATPRVPIQGWCALDRAREAPLPIDDSDGGCDDFPQCKQGAPWTRQIDTLQIQEGDAVTDSAEAYYLMEQRGVENVIVMGVHANMCVLGRPFSIRQMVRQGKHVLLVRDLTDTMYNSRQAPFVSHFAGTDLVVEHIERYWCPSITSADFLGGEAFRFRADHRPQVVFIIGENEYQTWETLPEFARKELEWRGFHCSFVMAGTKVGDNDFANYDRIKQADLVFLSARRRTPQKEMLDLLRAHLSAGKPLVAIRTASHGFDAKPPDSAHENWPAFDREILGAHYENHYSNGGANGARTVVRPVAGAHAILTGIATNDLIVTSSLYKSRDLVSAATVLMWGSVENTSDREPVAWVNTAEQRRVFYTSLGAPDDFKQAPFRQLLVNGIYWALDQPVPPRWVTRD